MHVADRSIKDNLLTNIRDSLDYRSEMNDEAVENAVDKAILSDPEVRKMSPGERRTLRRELFNSLRRLDLIQGLLEDPEITEIMINGRQNIYIEKAGRISRFPGEFDSDEKLADVIQQIVSGCNRSVNEANPLCDGRLGDGSRINVVLSPVALNGPIVTIRKFPEKPITIEKLIELGSITSEGAECLRTLVRAGYNIFISGGTGSGKTTFLNVLSSMIPSDQRVITIEDSAELQLQGLPNLVRLETRSSDEEGCRNISIRDLIRASLRMRPDRIILGEVRGEEAMDMLQCMNTGHDGSMCTGHANSAYDCLARLESMILMGGTIPLEAITGQIARGIDIIVHLGRLRDRTRRVLEITELTEYRRGRYILNPLFEFVERGEDSDGRIIGSLERRNELEDRRKIIFAGLS